MSSTIKRNVAIFGSAAVIAALGLGGLASANADPTAPAVPSGSQSEKKADLAEPDGEEADDGPDVGPDADPNEPGHQDADGDDNEESETEGEEAEDGPDVGPDADPNEPGHQDADDDDGK